MNRTGAGAAVLLLAASIAMPSAAAEFNIQQGQRLARSYCANCHAVERSGVSPMAIAPTFRVLAERLDERRLRELFETNLDISHPTMPRFMLERDQLSDISEYLKSLK